MALRYTSIVELRTHISENVLAELTDDVPGSPDTQVDAYLTEALEGAESMVDSYAAVNYTLPLASVPSSLKRAAYIVAKHDLLLRRHVIEEDSRNQYTDTIQWLEWLAEGKVALVVDTGTEEVGDSSAVGFATGDPDDNPNVVFDTNSNAFI